MDGPLARPPSGDSELGARPLSLQTASIPTGFWARVSSADAGKRWLGHAGLVDLGQGPQL